jgi:hypothetical protein
MEGIESGQRRIRQYDIQIEIRLTRSKTDISTGEFLEDAECFSRREMPGVIPGARMAGELPAANLAVNRHPLCLRASHAATVSKATFSRDGFGRL